MSVMVSFSFFHLSSSSEVDSLRSAISSSIFGHAGLANFVGLFLQCFALDLEAHDLAAGLLQLGRHVLERYAQARSGLVDEVDDFVRQEPVCDIAAGQSDGGHDGVIGYPDAVEELVFFLEAAQDGDGVLRRRLD